MKEEGGLTDDGLSLFIDGRSSQRNTPSSASADRQAFFIL
jgi:hypothetical protein